MAFYTRTAAGTDYILKKEDVSDFITNIDPTKTPFGSSLGVVSMNGSPHLVNEDTLATATADNAAVEGQDATSVSDTTPTQRSTYAQIITKTAEVSGSLEARDIYGMTSQLAYQVAKKIREAKRDRELSFISTNATVAPAGGATAGKLAGIFNLISTNSDTTTTTLSTATGQAAVNTLLASIYDGGGEPTTIYVNSTNKKNISENWTTNVTRYDQKNITTATEIVSIYESDFGRMNIQYHWQMVLARIAIIQPDMWRIASPKGRAWFVQDLAITGDKRSKQILSECTLECRSEKANGEFTGLTS